MTRRKLGKPASLSAAQRQRIFRERKRAGKRVLAIEVETEFVDQLVEWGWIGADQVKDPSALGGMIQDIVECKARGMFRPGPIIVSSNSTGA